MNQRGDESCEETTLWRARNQFLILRMNWIGLIH